MLNKFSDFFLLAEALFSRLTLFLSGFGRFNEIGLAVRLNQGRGIKLRRIIADGGFALSDLNRIRKDGITVPICAVL